MAEVDRLAVDEFGIGILQMMEQAGSHLAEVVRLELGGDLRGRRIVVATGPGNNGGGGLTAARHLSNRGADVRVVLARPAMRSSEASRHQLATLLAMEIDCCVAMYDLADDELAAVLASADAIVDAIVGYNLSGPPRDDVERLIGFVIGAQRPVISLDLPSGLDPDTGLTPGIAVTAAATMTLALPKPGLSKADGPGHTGRLSSQTSVCRPACTIGLAWTAGPSSRPAASYGCIRIDDQHAQPLVALGEARAAG